MHNNADLDPISNLELNPEHVQQRFSECFPSRKMKVFRGKQPWFIHVFFDGFIVSSAGHIRQKERVDYGQRWNKGHLSGMLPRDEDWRSSGRLLPPSRGFITIYSCRFIDCYLCQLQIHVYRHHLKEPRLYECPLCDFSHHACSSDVRAHIK